MDEVAMVVEKTVGNFVPDIEEHIGERKANRRLKTGRQRSIVRKDTG